MLGRTDQQCRQVWRRPSADCSSRIRHPKEHRSGHEVRIAIVDWGIGIDSSELALIFDPFYRSPRVNDAQIHGTGLGCLWQRELRKRWAEGSQYLVSFPPAARLPCTCKLLKEKRCRRPRHPTGHLHRHAYEREHSHRRRRRRIVHDSGRPAAQRRIRRRSRHRRQCRIRKGNQPPFDLIILDIMLPHRSGLDLCSEIRRAGIATPILLLPHAARPSTKSSDSSLARTTMSQSHSTRSN